LLFAQVEHRAWLLGMEKYLSGEAGELPPLAENQCRLGRWLATKGRVAYAGYAEFQAAERVHRKVHALVTELDELKAKGRSCEALARIDELHVLKDALIAHLKALQGQGSAP
jgi:hypothetical protein